MFADDTTIIHSAKNSTILIDKMNKELQNVSMWFKANKLSINVTKTCYIIFKSKCSNAALHALYLDSIQITPVEHTKFLGVEVDSSLNWKHHILCVEKKISSVIGVLYKIRYKLNQSAALLIYDALIQSHLSYCNIVWGSTYVTSLVNICSLQKRALRLCYGMVSKKGSTKLFAKSERLSITNYNKFLIGKFMYMLLYGHCSPNIHNIFNLANLRSVRVSTRNSHKLHIQYARTNLRKFSFNIRGALIWNEIPDNIKAATSVAQFSRLYKTLLYS